MAARKVRTQRARPAVEKADPLLLMPDDVSETGTVRSDPRYDELPVPVKGLYSPEEYAWLSDAEKANLISNATEPETD